MTSLLKRPIIDILWMYVVFKGDVNCFGASCYPLAFGVPAILMITSVGKCLFKLAGCFDVLKTKYLKTVLKEHRSPHLSQTISMNEGLQTFDVVFNNSYHLFRCVLVWS